MDVKNLWGASAPDLAPTTARARAANGTTPDATRIRFTVGQRAKLERHAKTRSSSIAQVVRDLVDNLK